MTKQLHIQIPDPAARIIERIQGAGYEAYVVGGCVRDSILGRTPQDWDITTSATPDRVKALFPRTVDTGLQHGTVTVMMDREGFEVTTYRIDGEYEDSRHPKEVIFTPNLEEDLRRRDFTINAMAYNDTEGLVDLYGGIEDINAGIIRCVGEPLERFTEDALRILRAVRFSAQLGYKIEEKTRNAIRQIAPNLAHISAERISAELSKILTSPHPDYLRDAYELGLTGVFFPEFDAACETMQNHPHHRYTVGEHTLHALTRVEPDRSLRLAVLLHDIGKPSVRSVDENGIDHFYDHAAVGARMSEEILRRWKFDNDTIRLVTKLVLYHDDGSAAEPTIKNVRRMVAKIGQDAFPALFRVQRADILAQSDYQRTEKLERNRRREELYRQICEEKQCVSVKMLAVNGKDLQAAGIAPGPRMGEVLQELLNIVLDDPECNTREQLLEIAVGMCDRR